MMSNAIKNVMEKIDARVMRERVLIFVSLLAVVFLLWDFLLQSRFDKVGAQLDLESQKNIAEQQLLEARITELSTALVNDPAILKQTEIKQLNERIAELDARLLGMSQGLISAEHLPKALEDVLNKTTAIKVLQVTTLPANELKLENPVADPSAVAGVNKNDAAIDLGTGVYRHGVLIRVSGSYQQLLQLLVEIEALPWRFYWESLDYRVTSYPNATIDIRVFTLTSEEGLLGV